MKRSCFLQLREIGHRIDGSEQILLFLDFDGTLAPIVADPAQARLPRETREILVELSRREGLTLAVISGRSLADVRSRVGIPHLIYAGNHGLEITGPSVFFVEPEAAALRPAIATLFERLSARAGRIPGVVIENKGLGVSVHYRQVREVDLPKLEGEVVRALGDWSRLFHLAGGRKVFEIRPRVNWQKGSAAAWIRSKVGRTNWLGIYAGDDVTDEDAFSSLADWITIQIGDHQASAAHYHLENPLALQTFLYWLGSRTTPRLNAK